MIEVSVVIATFRRRDVVRKTIERLAHQTYPAGRFEVIVVDDGSDDGTGPAVEAMIPRMPFSLTYLRHQNRGPGATENRGIRAARGAVVILLADDIHPTPALVESHARYHRNHPEPHVAILGRVLQSSDLPETVFQKNWDPFKYYELDGATELPYWKFWACNISVKRQFLLDHGMFQEWQGAAHEDVELGFRLSRHGLRILYSPEALAYHYHVETLEAAARRAYERGLNWSYVEDHIPDPQIYVKYHILNWRTLKHHVATFRNLSQSSLPPGDRNLPLLLSKQIIRWLVFNGISVSMLWMRLLPKAETSPFVAALVNPYMYRGAVFYHFVKGCRDAARLRRNSADSARMNRAFDF